MQEKIKLVQGDTRPQIKCVIADQTTGEPQNIAGATVLLRFKAIEESELITTLTGILLPGLENEDRTVSTEGFYATPGTGGRVVFVPTLEMTVNPPGNYQGELEVTFADGSIQTVYAVLKFVIRKQF
jgi:hypothetical protein